MLVVGLTGGIGSGKSAVANLFAAEGVTVIDTDKLARDLTAAHQVAFTAIVEKFGNDVVREGQLNRKKLREIIFADEAKRLWLEQLLHPLIRNELARQVELSKSPYCLAVIPLLFETTPNPLIKRILVVDAPEHLQIERTLKRDQLTEEAVRSIMATQVNRLKRLAEADDIIYNDGSIEELIPKVKQLHRFYLTL